MRQAVAPLILFALAWTVCQSVAVAWQKESADALPLVMSRQYAFRIPFTVDGVPQGAKYAAEVQLHVSEDRGVTWQLGARVPPENREFQFRAPHDGEFWFLVRTKDLTGRLRPEGPPSPQMRVLVDTQPPQIEVLAQRDSSGELTVRVRVSDGHLRPETLKLTFQTSTGQWRTIAAEPLVRERASPGKEEAFTGQTRVVTAEMAQATSVRAEIQDLAGNTATAQAIIESSTVPLITPSNPNDRATAPPNTTPTAPPAESLPPPLAQIPSNPQVSTTARPVSAPPTSPSSPSIMPPATTLPAPQLPAQSSIGVPGMPVSNPPSAVPPVTPPAEVIQAEPLPTPSPLPMTQPINEPDPVGPPPARVPPIVERPGTSALPTGIQPRMINSRRFEMEYDVSQIGPEGVGRVELWLTRDNGRTWVKRGEDEDRRSPYVIVVDDDGLFGFRMVVETAAGLRSSTPQSGDLPDVWIGVDTVAPTARLLPIDNAPQGPIGVLTIRFEAYDAQLSARPIALSFAADASGPWTPIASGLENSGRYDWKLDSRVPGKIFLRLEVRDEAGNVTTVTTPEAVSIDHVRPQGKILNVRPVGGS